MKNPPSNCYPAARKGTDADGAGVAQRLSLEAHLPRLPDNDPSSATGAEEER